MHLTLYQTASRLYVVRQQSAGEEEFRVLKLDRTTAALEAVEDPTPYTKAQVQRLLATVHAGEPALRACSCRVWLRVASTPGCQPAHTHTPTHPAGPPPPPITVLCRQPAARRAAAGVRGTGHHWLRALSRRVVSAAGHQEAILRDHLRCVPCMRACMPGNVSVLAGSK